MQAALLKSVRSRSRLSSLINGLAYEPTTQVFVLTDRRLGFAFSCAPLSGSNGDEGARLRAGLNVDWPDNTILQFSLICTENINKLKFGYLRLREDYEESGRNDVSEAT